MNFVRVTAFSGSACIALLALGDGDSMVAGQVLTVYGLERRRKAVQLGEDEHAAAPAPTPRSSQPPARSQGAQQRRIKPDHDTFAAAGDDAWLAGGAP